MSEKSLRFPIIDSLRGLAALSVVFYHLVCTTIDYITNETILDIFSFGKYGVQVFFIISGIVIPLSMVKSNYTYSLLPKFIAKRFIRIEPPYLGAVVIGIVYLTVRNYIPSSAPVDLTPSLRDTLLHIGYLVPFFDDADWINPVFWTLSVEFQYYLYLALIIPLILSKNVLLKLIFYILLILPPLFTFNSSFFPFWSAYFSFGIFYILFILGKISKVEYIVFTILSGFVVFYRLGFLNLAIGISTIMVIHFFKNYKSSIGKFLGKISYSLYLLHTVFGAAFVNFMSHRFRLPYEKFIVIILGVLISILTAFIYWKLVEKPSQKLSNKIKMNN